MDLLFACFTLAHLYAMACRGYFASVSSLRQHQFQLFQQLGIRYALSSCSNSPPIFLEFAESKY